MGVHTFGLVATWSMLETVSFFCLSRPNNNTGYIAFLLVPHCLAYFYVNVKPHSQAFFFSSLTASFSLSIIMIE